MDDTKETLINNIVIALGDKTTLSLGELKNSLITELYNYSVTKIDSAELSTKNGDATKSLLQYFIIGKKSANRQDNTIEQYVLTVKQLCSTVNKELNMITPEDIQRFLIYGLDGKGWQYTTSKNKYLALSSVFNYLFNHKKIFDNPITSVDTPKIAVKLEDAFTDDQIEKIKIAVSGQKNQNKAKRDLALVYFFLDTGCRVSEVASLTVANCDFTRRIAIINGKGNKQRKVSWSPKTQVRLEEYFKVRKDISYNGLGVSFPVDTPLFVVDRKDKTGNYRPLTDDSIEYLFRELSKICDVGRIHAHRFRKTFATNMEKKGCSTSAIVRALGHANYNTINRYLRMTDSDALMEVQNNL